MKIYSETPSLDETDDDEIEISDEVEAAELACSSGRPACPVGRLELCEASEEEEEIAGWELSDDVDEEEDEDDSEFKLELLELLSSLEN